MEADVTLTDGRIVIRPCRLDDAAAIYQAVRESISEVSRWAPWCGPDYSISDCTSWLRSRSQAWSDGAEYDFVVLDAAEDTFLGGCGLNQINREHNFANLGYWVRTGRTGRGVATAAVRLIARFGFQELRLSRLEIVAAVANRTSQRVAEKAGAVREGVQRNRHLVRDMLYDAVMFSLVPQDLQQ